MSLPTPFEPSKASADGKDTVLPNHFEEKTLNKLLLVGSDKSGTSTIFKQVSNCWENFIYEGYIDVL